MASCVASVDPYFQQHHKVTIPPLQCSQPMRLHPRFESIREETNSWLLSVTQPTTIEGAKVVVQTQIPRLVCSAYANAQDERRCSAVAKFIAWTFMMDDMLDIKEFETPFSSFKEQNLKDAIQQVTTPIEEKDSLTATIGLQLRQFLDANMDIKGMQWWAEMTDLGMSPIMQRRFLKAFAHSLEVQKGKTSRHDVPNIETYVETRRIVGGVPILLLLSEWCVGIEISEEIERNPLLWELNLAVNDYICWVNDLLSLKWEYTNGDLSNLPTVICNQLRQAPTGCPDNHIFQKSIDMVHHMVRMRDHDFSRLVRHAHSTPSLMDTPGMPLYLEALGNWMSGHLHWCYATSRYHGLDLCDPLPLDAPLTFLLSPKPK